jgi:hypothetical protein
MTRRRDDDRGTRQSSARRPPPPAVTGREQRWFEELRARGRSVLVRLDDGTELRGRVGAHDRDSFALSCDDGVEIVVRKNDVRTVTEL